jgi:hypothetical protein
MRSATCRWVSTRTYKYSFAEETTDGPDVRHVWLEICTSLLGKQCFWRPKVTNGPAGSMTANERQMKRPNHDLLPACRAGRQGWYSLLNVLLQ